SGAAYAAAMGAPIDWGTGHYEETAAQLQRAAEVVIAAARVRAGERVLDVGCGTGNAALLAAQAGAQVVGVDPAARLLDVARDRAAAEQLAVTFLPGDAAAIPLEDSSADAVVSVFAVIFAPDPEAAAAEMARVLAPGGRIVLSAWWPDGAMIRMTSKAADTVRKAVGAPPAPPGFAWQDQDALSALFAPYGLHVTVDEHSLAFTATSAKDYFDLASRHPMAVVGLAVLDRLGQGDALRADLLALVEDGNEDPAAFRMTSRYVVATASDGSEE
ncbi:MAG TPA: methyltransferase domain-containing protein, partial [Jatrophihabitantaceae bacterium]|nr:methyltransferase domain-containing protein [Jatrophihabitantaceae bacterium]